MDAPTGSLVSFATAPGRTAADGDGRNGLFTGFLLKYMSESGMELTKIMKNVRKAVRENSNGKQVPWDVSSLEGDFYFNDARGSRKSVTVASASTPVKTETVEDIASEISPEEQETWDLVKNSNVEDLKLFIRSFPNGFYKNQAEEKIWVRSHGSIRNLETYLTDNPKGKYRDLAVRSIFSTAIASRDISKIGRCVMKFPDSQYAKQAEDKAWQMTKRSNDIYLFKRFRKDFPNSRFQLQAKILIKKKMKKLGKKHLVIDRTRGFMWQKEDPGKMKWQEAVNYCSKLKLAGYTDWKLPDQKELQWAFKTRQRFSDYSRSAYWSSTSYAKNDNYAWTQYFLNGTMSDSHKGFGSYVRCVRVGRK